MFRVPEPELMDDPAQALAYAWADFSEPNRLFVELFEHYFGKCHGAILDLGCGPGDITLRLARSYPFARVDGVDGSGAMLNLARQTLGRDPALANRVRFVHARVPEAELPEPRYQAVVSNSLLHHLHEPAGLWRMVARRGVPGAAILVMDLFRPETTGDAADVVRRYAGNEPEVLRRDFYNSLCAAFTLDEVRMQVGAAGMSTLNVDQVSDRHLVVYGNLIV